MLLLLLTTLSSAPLVATPPRPPDTVMPVVAVIVAAATDPTLRLLLEVSAACLPAMIVLMSTPARYSGPASSILDPIIADPPTSMEGALTGHENTALLLVSPNLSVPPWSARRSV